MAAAKIRSLVSKNKRRYQEDGFNLDLSYILPNIIAMGFPAEKFEGVYRNHIDDVVRFLDTKHKDRYKVYNLCRDRNYDKAKFGNRVQCYPFDDHHPPSVNLMLPFCEDVHKWLTEREDNVVAIHCKAGKGRTGVMICAYLLYIKRFDSADKTLAFYGERRTNDKNGVTIPSQRCYVHYFSRMLNENLQYRPVKMVLRSITFEGLPSFQNGSCSPLFVVYSNEKKVYKSTVVEPDRSSTIVKMPVTGDVEVEADVRIDFYHKPTRLPKKEKMFHFWFNTFFVCPNVQKTCSNNAPLSPKLSDSRFNGNIRTQVSGDETVFDNTQNNGCIATVDSSCEHSDNDTASKSCRSNRHIETQLTETGSSSMSFHVLTYTRDELDRACKEKWHKNFPADFKVHVRLQCSDEIHCPTRCASPSANNDATVTCGKTSTSTKVGNGRPSSSTLPTAQESSDEELMTSDTDEEEESTSSLGTCCFNQPPPSTTEHHHLRHHHNHHHPNSDSNVIAHLHNNGNTSNHNATSDNDDLRRSGSDRQSSSSDATASVENLHVASTAPLAAPDDAIASSPLAAAPEASTPTRAADGGDDESAFIGDELRRLPPSLNNSTDDSRSSPWLGRRQSVPSEL